MDCMDTARMHVEQHLPGEPLHPAELGLLRQVHEAKFDKNGEFQGTTKVMDLKVRSGLAGSTVTDCPG